jgi:hypothetical protein
MAEFDACNAKTFSLDAFNKGHAIGERSKLDGNTGAAMQALLKLNQELFQKDLALPINERQAAWAAQSRDAMNGIACADPVHFKDSLRPLETDPRVAPPSPERLKAGDIASSVDGVASMLQGFAVNDTPFDYRLAQANAFVHNRVEPLGEPSRKAFVEDFNKREGSKTFGPNGARVAASLSPDGKQIVLKKIALGEQ